MIIEDKRDATNSYFWETKLKLHKPDKIDLYNTYVEELQDLEEMATKIVKMPKVADPCYYGKALSDIYAIEDVIKKLAKEYYEKNYGTIFVKEGDE